LATRTLKRSGLEGRAQRGHALVLAPEAQQVDAQRGLQARRGSRSAAIPGRCTEALAQDLAASA
jgi:hypothetical protein